MQFLMSQARESALFSQNWFLGLFICCLWRLQLNTSEQMQLSKDVLGKKQAQYTYTVTTVKDAENKAKLKNNHLIVNNSSFAPSQEELKFQDGSSDQMRPKNSAKKLLSKKIVEDYVQLPKINLVQQSIGSKPRKNSEVTIKLPFLQEQQETNNNNKTHVMSSDNESDYLDSIEEQKGEWANWNINKIKMTPSQNNYLESEDIEIPGSSAEKRKHSRKHTREKEREMERRERERNMERVSNFLSGKASMVWLFVLGDQITEQQINQVRGIYSQYTDYDYEVPVCRSYDEAIKFLKLENCFFKVVVDLDLSSHFLEDNAINKNVASIYIYNPRKIEGINRAFEMKRNLKKIKGMYTDLKEVTKQAHDDIQNEAKFIKVGEDIEREKNKLRFPSFIQLNGADSTDVTNYRLCLFGALKLKERKEREAYLKQFTDMVELRYKDVDKQLENLKDYNKIDHLGDNSQQKMREVLQFYVKQTFYYILTNSILRLSRNSQEFRPCTIPFNQTYHAIKHFYNKSRAEDKQKSSRKFVVYRGAKLRNSDIKAIEVGAYIELLGFTSTSLKRSEAEKFMDGDSYLFEIHIEEGARDQKEEIYDHGYVEINRYNLAHKSFQKEQEILINALNVFQVIALDFNSAIRKVTLKYGAIMPLLRVKSEQLTTHSKAVVQNYRYCLQTFQEIEDDGDVLLIAQQHDRCIDYYQGKVQNGGGDFKVFGKLAYAQLQGGDLDEAYNNALRSLQTLNTESKSSKEIQQTVNQLKKSCQIFDMKEDMVHYRNSMDMCLVMLKDDWLQSARVLKDKADISLKNGDLASAQKEIAKARALLQQKQSSFQLQRKKVERRYSIRSMCCGCTSQSSAQLEQKKQLQLLKIAQQEIQFQNRKDEVHQLLIEILTVQKEVCSQMNNQEMYKSCVEISQKHFDQMHKSPLNPIQQARIQVLSACVMDKHEHMPEYQQRMESAIKMVKTQDPFHSNIGVYSNVLGTERQVMVKKKLQLSPLRHQPIGISNAIQNDDYAPVSQQRACDQKFDYQECDAMKNKCKQAYKQAAQNIAYNHGKQYPEYLSVRNKMSELDLDSSRLQESQKMLKQTQQFALVNFHSEGARCYLLLTKISLAKGQLKNAFRNVQQSYTILRNTLLKVDNKQYNSVFINNPLYIEINLHKAKIFNRQLRHDLALKELKVLKKVAQLRRDKHHNASLLASVFEEEAQIEMCSGMTSNGIEEKILEAIQIREVQMGKYNIPNAVSYSNLFKFMMGMNDSQTALKYHLKAVQIFSRFPSDHPNCWILYFCNALIFFKDEDHSKCLDELQNCIKVTNHRYSKNHIVTLKVDYQYAAMMKKMQKLGRSMQVYQNMQVVIVQSLKHKESTGDRLQRQTDDEKFPLLRKVYTQLKDIHQQKSKEMNDMDIGSRMQVQKYNKQIQDMKKLIITNVSLQVPSKKSIQ